MSLIVSASQRFSTAAVVTVSRVVLGAGLRASRPGVKGRATSPTTLPVTSFKLSGEPAPPLDSPHTLPKWGFRGGFGESYYKKAL
jgi:hypothetical protein